MGDNPYKYCNLQWEIIHTLLSCDNIFFVHVLYVFSLVLFCLLMIVQCLDFKSIKLLLLFLPKCLKIAETIVVLIVFNGVICEVSAYTVTVSVARHESGTSKVFLDPQLYITNVYLTPIISTQNHTIVG